MRTETYRGTHLKVKKGRHWGNLEHFVNGVSWGDWYADSEESALKAMHGYVDAAIADPDSFADYWQPGYRKPRP